MTLAPLDGPAHTPWPELLAATAHLDPPFAVLDLAAVRTNAHQLVQRAAGKPIRVASKSIRVRSMIRDALELPGMSGILAFTLPEALWLAEEHDDVVVGYPTTHREALERLAEDELLASRITLMVDSPEHLDLTARIVGPDGPPIRICLELDVSLRLAGGRLHVGARRSPVRTPEEAAALAREVVAHPRFELVGLMGYEGQIAGVGDNQPGLARYAVRAMQRRSAAELAERRAEAVAAVRSVAPLEFVNGGGTGSLELTAAEPAVTEVAAGSGLFAPRLFDFYTRFHPQPAAYFVLSVVRRPSPRHATVLGGGWVASGAAGKDRLPTPVWPPGLSLVDQEGAGEVQTPLVGERVADLGLGDHVWFRHTKAGELSEHVDEMVLVDGDRIVGVVPTYRGEGKTFL
ncbi:D-serine deaminase-like pyridoxal phosphate-dependent protein [Nocardioides luteus]|uniref:Alanine racemase n=1 Tax=Nocardioides luteus TaxID=1844 RepID=A0ABQ5SXW6_9ACTN|nr:amino acid deaminase/aldolase [Nocardioides luteus]MDR7312773.1 D-serine deaminase-like pyridoxal phosphate-dependent protein [Nocardioides luteus]GGR47438.1 alanine racemase [Nocardioides luteus]GLJ69025.1 alanine racemase [Nocardioides luteus]